MLADDGVAAAFFCLIILSLYRDRPFFASAWFWLVLLPLSGNRPYCFFVLFHLFDEWCYLFVETR